MLDCTDDAEYKVPFLKLKKKFLHKNKFATTKLKQQNCSNNNTGGFYSLLHLNQLNAISESQQEMKCFQLKLLSITGTIKNASHNYLLFQKCCFFWKVNSFRFMKKKIRQFKDFNFHALFVYHVYYVLCKNIFCGKIFSNLKKYGDK